MVVFGTCLYVGAEAFTIEILWYDKIYNYYPIGTEDFFLF